MSEPVTDARILQYQRTEKAVSNWIEEVIKEPLSQPQNLQESLKDGTVICKLMTEIDPSSIPHIHYTTHAFRLKENISFFLLACEDLRVPSYKLFTINDLWEGNSIVAVVDCLEELANIVTQKGFSVPLKPLPETTSLPTLSKDEKEQLRILIAKLKRPVIKSRPKRTAGIAMMQLEYLARINGIKMDRVIAAITRMQAVVRGRRVRVTYKKYARSQAFRQKLIREIFTTEQTYLTGLKLCEKHYILPLQGMEHPIINDEQREGIFSNISEIVVHNSKFMADLENRVQRYFPNQRISDIFLNHMNFLDVYTPYVQNFDFSVALLAYLTIRNSNFHKFISERRELPESQGLDLSSYLITPIQRIPRYNLLLRDLIKYTTSETIHPDLSGLEEALLKMEETGKEINKRKGDSEGILRVAYLASTIGKIPNSLNLLQPFRRVLRFGLTGDSKQAVYLFTDVVILVRSKKSLLISDITPSCSLIVPPSKSQPKADDDPLLIFAGCVWGADVESVTGGKTVDLIAGKKPLLRLPFDSSEQEDWIAELNKWVEANKGGISHRDEHSHLTSSSNNANLLDSNDSEDRKKKWHSFKKGNRLSVKVTSSSAETEENELTHESEEKKKPKRKERTSWLFTNKKSLPLDLGLPTNFRHMNLKHNKDDNVLYVDPENPIRIDDSSQDGQSHTSSAPVLSLSHNTPPNGSKNHVTSPMIHAVSSPSSSPPSPSVNQPHNSRPMSPPTQRITSSQYDGEKPSPVSSPTPPPRAGPAKIAVIPPSHFNVICNRPLSSPAGVSRVLANPGGSPGGPPHGTPPLSHPPVSAPPPVPPSGTTSSGTPSGTPTSSPSTIRPPVPKR